MEVTIEEKGTFDRHLQVRIPAERIEQMYVLELDKVTRTIQMPGFRSGKVPRHLVEKRFHNDILADVADKLIKESLPTAITDKQLNLAGPPTVTPGPMIRGADFTFSAEVQIFPEVTPQGYQGVKLTRATATPNQGDVDKVVEQLRERNAEFVEDTSAQAANGDEVVLDFKGMIDGVAFEGGSAEAYTLHLGSGKFIPGFEEQLIGLQAGAEKEVNVTFPQDYHADMAGKAAVFQCRIREVRRRVLPVADDALASKAGVNEGGMAKLREDILARLNKDAANSSEQTLKQQVFQTLLAANPMELPSQLVDQEKERIRAEVRQRLQQNGLDVEKIKIDVDQFRPGMDKEARDSVTLGLLVGAIAREQKIEPTREQVEAHLQEYAVNFGAYAEQMLNFMRSQPERMEELKGAVVEKLVLEWIIAHGDVTSEEVDFDTLQNKKRQILEG